MTEVQYEDDVFEFYCSRDKVNITDEEYQFVSVCNQYNKPLRRMKEAREAFLLSGPMLCLCNDNNSVFDYFLIRLRQNPRTIFYGLEKVFLPQNQTSDDSISFSSGREQVMMSRSRITKSADLPTVMLPVSCSSPSCRAPLTV